MQSNNNSKNKQTIYRKIIGIGILTAVLLYCFPEIKETLKSEITNAKWRK